ncbi:MAG: AraC family transcriptional regulator [Christensenellales bacterium]|jgi:AraC-like DNA-binding protein
MDRARSRGYLNEDFRMFRIRDRRHAAFDFHFHSFNKVIVFLTGHVTYVVEDKAYQLKPWDVLAVNRGQVHRPVIAADEVYERVIFYLDPAYLNAQAPLGELFERVEARRYNILRPNARERLALTDLFAALEEELGGREFASQTLQHAIMTQIMVRFNRISLRDDAADEESFLADPVISEIVVYILANLASDLAIDRLAARFFVSPSFLMHRFRAVTGYSPHNYITIKRMAFAADLIAGGMPASDAARRCGYANYSSFSRAYRKQYGVSPTQPLPRLGELDAPMD